MPKISVVIPTYNAETYLKEAIDSILSQTFQDFEILVVDDGSKDGTLSILESYKNPKIQILEGPRRGISAALNMGLDKARGEYIARMDADDIALPQRFEKQVAFMDAHGDIGVCGSLMEAFSGDGSFIWNYSSDVRETKSRLLFYCALAHPAVMIRASVFKEQGLRYDENLRGAEDFDLWNRAMEFTGLCNLPEVLLRYRLHPQQASKIKLIDDKKNAGSTALRGMKKYLGVSIPQKYLYIFYASSEVYTMAELLEMDEIFYRAYKASQNNPMFSEESVLRNFSERLGSAALRSLKLFQLCSFYKKSLIPISKVSVKNRIKEKIKTNALTKPIFPVLKKAFHFYRRLRARISRP